MLSLQLVILAVSRYMTITDSSTDANYGLSEAGVILF